MEKILIFIPIENIGLEKYVQNLSLFTILSLIFSLYYLISLKRIKKSPILNKLFLLILWLIIVTVVRFFLTQYVGEDFERVFAGFFPYTTLFRSYIRISYVKIYFLQS